MTELESKMLKAIALDEYNEGNGSEPDCTDDVHTWTDVKSWAMILEITEPQAKGVLSSLVKKGLIEMDTESGRENCTWFTDQGFSAYKSL